MSRLAEALKRASTEQEMERHEVKETVVREKPAPVAPKLAAAEAVIKPEAVAQAEAATTAIEAESSTPAPRVSSPVTSLMAEKLVVTPSISPVSLEQYRRLAATLH